MYKIVCEDTFIWHQDKLITYLYRCLKQDKDIELDFNLEGPCAQQTGLYSILDQFCTETNFSADRIKIKTGNLIEHHSRYNIQKIPQYWYEMSLIKQWLQKNKLTLTDSPSKHFGNFVGRSTWARLWVASALYSRHKNKTVQTFHSGLQSNYITPASYNVTDTIGLDDLNRHGCNDFDQIVNFLKKCPVVLSHDYIALDPYIVSVNKNYPIQHPANLTILNHYNDFFIDIVSETRVEGNLFFATEKLWRPIIARRPFIVAGPGNFLKNLRKLGFKTFNNFWDEGYDDYNSSERIKLVVQLIDNLGSMSIREIKNLVLSMNHILDHNYNVFMNLTYSDLDALFND